MIIEKKNNDGEEHSNNKEQRQKEKKDQMKFDISLFLVNFVFFFNNCYNFVSYMNLEFKKHDFMSLVLMNSSSLFDHCSNLRPGLGW